MFYSIILHKFTLLNNIKQHLYDRAACLEQLSGLTTGVFSIISVMQVSRSCNATACMSLSYENPDQACSI